MTRRGLIGAGVTVACFAVYFGMSYRAGCVGDTKTGSYGDPSRALQVESMAFVVFLIGIAMAGFFIAALSTLRPSYRIVCSLGFLLVGVPVLWLIAMQFEEWGNESCLWPKTGFHRTAESFVSRGMPPNLRLQRTALRAAAEPPDR